MTASPSRIVPCVTSSPMLLARSLQVFIKPSCTAGRWAWGPRLAMSRLRVKTAKRNIVPLSVDEVARFWSSFRTSRDLAIVGLMLLQGLRSGRSVGFESGRCVAFRSTRFAFAAKATNFASCRWRRKRIQLLDHYLRLERPNPCSAALFVSLKGPARGTRMTPAGLRSLFRYHRQTTGIKLANPHRFRHTFASDMVRAGVSLPALMQLMGHADIQTTLHLCASHSTRCLSTVRACGGAAHPSASGDIIVNRARRPPLQHPSGARLRRRPSIPSGAALIPRRPVITVAPPATS